jgi:uncharacterized protein
VVEHQPYYTACAKLLQAAGGKSMVSSAAVILRTRIQSVDITILVIVFLAVLTQSVTGFGLALVAMGLLSRTLGVQTTAPLIALIAVPLEFALLVRHRQAVRWRPVWRLSLAALVGIPIGILGLRYVNERIVLTILGLVLVAYAMYALRVPRLPELRWPGWAFGFGFLSGLLGGAYNTAGPPAVVYGNTQRWEPAEFKSNLQGFFLIHDAMVITGHAWSQHYTPAVWAAWRAALPGLGLGLVVGLLVERHINPAAFRRIVLWLLIAMGLRLFL